MWAKSLAWVRSNRLAAAGIAFLFLAASGAALDSCRARGESKAILERATTETEAMKSTYAYAEARYVGEIADLRARLAVAEAKEASAMGKLEASRRAAATPWTRPQNAAALADRFERLGYSGVCR